MIFIGIDPGLSGAIAIISPSGIKLHDTPAVLTGKGREYDLDALLSLLQSPTEEFMIKAAIENVHAMPKQGVTSMFKMGYGLGLWHAALVAKSIPFLRVEPQRWKKEFGLRGKNKEGSRLRAIELFPEVREQLQRKKDDGRAEALLIAEWLRRSALYGQASTAAHTEPTKL